MREARCASWRVQNAGGSCWLTSTESARAASHPAARARQSGQEQGGAPPVIRNSTTSTHWTGCCGAAGAAGAFADVITHKDEATAPPVDTDFDPARGRISTFDIHLEKQGNKGTVPLPPCPAVPTLFAPLCQKWRCDPEGKLEIRNLKPETAFKRSTGTWHTSADNRFESRTGRPRRDNRSGGESTGTNK
jgi:hypothetical protein